MHLATEMVVRFEEDRRPYPALCLATSTGDLTAIANDYAFSEVFARQVEAFGQPGDVLVALSTSGRSENVRRAIEVARARQVRTIAFLGKDGGPTKGLAEVELLVAVEGHRPDPGGPEAPDPHPLRADRGAPPGLTGRSRRALLATARRGGG